MALLLDTNVVSAARRPERQTEIFRAFLDREDKAESYISVITIMEIEFGITLERRNDTKFAADLTRWLDGMVLPSFVGRILPFGIEAARFTGRMPTPERRPTPDAMIAATAAIHGLTVATRNIGDFTPFGIPCINPWVDG